MAILRKDQKKDPVVPVEIQCKIDKGFEQQFLAAWYDEQFKATKQEVKEAIEASQEITMIEGTGFKVGNGMLIPTKARDRIDYNLEAMVELVKANTISIDDFAACISTFNAKKVDEVFTGQEVKVTTPGVGYGLTFRSNAEMKKNFSEKAEQIGTLDQQLRASFRGHESKVTSITESADRAKKDAAEHDKLTAQLQASLKEVA